MIERLKRRVARAGLQDRVDARTTPAQSLGIDDLRGSVDFTLAFAVVHELPDAGRFFEELAAISKPGASVLVAEPSGHVKNSDFDAQLQSAAQAGFSLSARPTIRRSLTALLTKN